MGIPYEIVHFSMHIDIVFDAGEKYVRIGLDAFINDTSIPVQNACWQKSFRADPESSFRQTPVGRSLEIDTSVAVHLLPCFRRILSSISRVNKRHFLYLRNIFRLPKSRTFVNSSAVFAVFGKASNLGDICD